MKKILITPRIDEVKEYTETREALDERWGQIAQKLDYLFIPISYSINPEVYFQELNIDGILLTGGNNLSKVENSSLSKKRDDFEKELIKTAMEKNIPLLGVCRGLQILADYFGATIQPCSGHAATEHPVKIVSNITENNYFNHIQSVNSYHDFAVSEIPAQLEVVAQSEDNNVEAFRHKEHPIMAIMWHPERDQPIKPESLNFIKEFFA